MTAKFNIYHLNECLNADLHRENIMEQKYFLPKLDFQKFSKIGIDQFYIGF